MLMQKMHTPSSIPAPYAAQIPYALLGLNNLNVYTTLSRTLHTNLKKILFCLCFKIISKNNMTNIINPVSGLKSLHIE